MKNAAILLFALTFAVLSRADHLPEKLMAIGEPETTLAGINLKTATVESAVQRYGPPTRKIEVPNNPYWTGYIWEKSAFRLEIDVTRSKEKQYVGGVSIVRVAGNTLPTALDTAETTGKGLKLGDDIDCLKRIYGTRFELSRQTNTAEETSQPFGALPGERTATLQWRKLEFTLTAGFDAGGRIIALRLRPPECYPGGCK